MGAAGKGFGVVLVLVDFQIGGVYPLFFVGIADIEVVAAAEEAVLAGEVELEAVLRVVFGVAHGHVVVFAVEGASAVESEVVQAVAETL